MRWWLGGWKEYDRIGGDRAHSLTVVESIETSSNCKNICARL